MTKYVAFGSLLLLSSALVAPAALAQSQGSAPIVTPPPATPETTIAEPPAGVEQPVEEQVEEQPVEVSAPGAGGDIIVTGRRDRNIVRVQPQVLNVLSQEDIARTGEGDIAGALSRVTGLSVVGNGFVFVRGLGDRYSSALLNGSPLPSPEPLRRVVPLDIFPTSVVASALVQKSYSVNYPGEFGGGVINLTTRAVPNEPFLSFGISGSGDSETTGHHGYSYYGSDTDYTGFDDGTRDFPAGLREALSTNRYSSVTTAAQRQAFATALVNAPTTLLQRIGDVPANVGVDLNAGRSWDFLGGRLGVIFGVGYSNSWRNRDAIQQSSSDPNLAGQPQTSYERVTTDNRIVVNGLLGLGYEIGEHRFRLTELFIRDTLKQGRIARGYNLSSLAPIAAVPFPSILQDTYWFERQLADLQAVAELRFGALHIDLRGTLANTRRQSPYERNISYTYLGDGNTATRGVGDVDDYVNNLTSGGQGATIAFSELNEDVRAGAIDISYNLDPIPMTISAGYAYTETERTSFRYQLRYRPANGALPQSVSQARPDYLLSDFVINRFNIELLDISGQDGAAAYDASLRIHAGYVQTEIQVTPEFRIQTGVRYETADQFVTPVGVGLAGTTISNDYFLPAITATWEVAPRMQFRIAGSKTIARPQFRELAQQLYQDFESDRQFTGNPFLQDSELYNGEIRYEYYFGRNQRFTLAGFYKRIQNPIEQVAIIAGGEQLRSGFANAPSARLYGGEVEFQYYYPLNAGGWLADRQLFFIGNYTYTQSEISASNQIIRGPSLELIQSNLLFRQGDPLAGQSDHLVNVQIGIESTDRVSQATFLFNYASQRVLDRGAINSGQRLPDIVENPGLRVDFVAREEMPFLGRNVELRIEARNIFGRDHIEYQQSATNRIDVNTYQVGRSFSLGATFRF